jgi:hypothetical protein
MATKFVASGAPKNPDDEVKDHRNQQAYSAGPTAGGSVSLNRSSLLGRARRDDRSSVSTNSRETIS